MSQLTSQMGVVAADQSLLSRSYDEVAVLRRDIRDQLTSAQVFQSNKCSACSRPLELPAVHFMCRHSFHSKCLSNAKECNLCAAAYRPTLEKREEMLQEVNDNEGFFKDLHGAAPEGRFQTQFVSLDADSISISTS